MCNPSLELYHTQSNITQITTPILHPTRRLGSIPSSFSKWDQIELTDAYANNSSRLWAQPTIITAYFHLRLNYYLEADLLQYFVLSAAFQAFEAFLFVYNNRLYNGHDSDIFSGILDGVFLEYGAIL